MYYQPELRNHFAIDTELKNRFKSIGIRDNEKESTNHNFKIYEYNLSHSRAIARISTRANKQYFQGSSINRKKTIKKQPPEFQAQAETLDQSFFKNEQLHNQLLRNVKNANKRKQNFGNENVMSRRTKIKIKEKMLAVFAASKNNFTLCTLTMVNDCIDTKAVKLLNNFLTATKKQIGSYNYVWVAERQNNGRVHFHIVIDQRLNIHYINSLWIVQQYNAGIYHEAANNKLMLEAGLTFKQLHKQGEKGFKLAHKYLNPVDIIKVKSIDGVSAYLTNYVIKNETKMSCSIWHCNRNVSKLFTKQLISKQQFNTTSNSAINQIKSKKGKLYQNKTFIHQYGMINTIYNKKYFNTFLKEMNLLNSWILQTDYRDKNKANHINDGINIDFEHYQQILYSLDPETGELKTPSNKDYKTSSQIIWQLKKDNPELLVQTKFINKNFIHLITNKK